MTRCPLCHKLHDDPPDVDAGRVRVCIACHANFKGPRIPDQRKPKPKPKRKPPPSTDAAPTAVSPEESE